MPNHRITPKPITLSTVQTIFEQNQSLELSKKSRKAIQKCRDFLEQKIEKGDTLYYGINTGFGSLCDVGISEQDLEELQSNLVQSHACGTGEEVPQDIVKVMLFLKIKGLSQGFSGIRVELVERLIFFYNNDVLPVIYQQGSLGASGDLAPLAHLSLPLIGKGKVYLKGKKVDVSKALKALKIKPLKLKAKEGLALLNGTQFSSAYATWCLIKGQKLMQLANMCAAMSVDAFDCRLSPFNNLLHKIRPHKGQIFVAKQILKTLKGSEIANSEKVSVQDPYAFRCVPQVHGASFDTINYVKSVLETEINAVTDNPTLFPDDDEILSGGNFHAQPLALALDFLAIALAELGSISERRIYQLIAGNRGLPKFLTEDAGLHSGMMIPQYTAASIVSQNKQLCTPASVDSIVSCNGQEDHVSMAANAGTKAYRVVKNVENILGIEFMNAAQAIEFREMKSSKSIEKLIKKYRKIVSKLEGDRVLSEDMAKTLEFLKKEF